MSYLGNTPTTQNFISGTDYFNGTGAQTAFTLSRTVNSVNDIQVTVNNVVQQPNDAYTLSGTTLTMTSAPSAGTNNVYVRYLSTTTQVITPSQNTVSWNTLDANTQGDLGISFKNKIINGNMAIDQRNAGASVTPTTNSYTLDRWIGNNAAASKLTVQQSSTAPTGFSNSLLVTSTSAYTPSSTEPFYVSQRVEGFNWADLGWGSANAKTVTLSFWVRSSLTGTFSGSFQNSATDYSYPYTYTISSANTWEYKTVTIVGPTAGTWIGATNGIGLRLYFSMGAGSTYRGTAGSWAATDYRAATGEVSIVSTNGATWYITGVQLETGTQATTFTLAGGSYGAELALCQRYFYSMGGNADYEHFSLITVTGSGATSTDARGMSFLPVQMRTVPSIGQSGSFQAAGGGQSLTGTYSAGTTMYYSISLFGGRQNIGFDFWPGTAGTFSTTNGACYVVRANNSTATRVTFSAEL